MISSVSSRGVVLLSGGGGGARLAAALHQQRSKGPLTILTNTGDDFEHLGLTICPDTDSVIYAVTEQLDRERGWGRSGETWNALSEITQMGGPDWFQLGDRDLALHLQRAALLAEGKSMSEVTATVAGRLGLTGQTLIIPASEQPIRTQVLTDQGEMAFQEYFVARRCEPRLLDVRYQGMERALPNPAFTDLLQESKWHEFDVIVGPSNPLLSVAPILDIPGMASLLRQRARRVVAVSPIVGGRALKGPAAKIMTELAMSVSAQGWTQWIDQRYPGLIDTWVWDKEDQAALSETEASAGRVRFTNTVMSQPKPASAFADWLIEECLGDD
ncbi:MAG: 2-phospho-L-lactate transferase CofD family protein [Halieaceae bacterium]